MKTKLILLLLVIAMAGCSTSREGCAGASYQGPKFKSKSFDWGKLR